MNRENVESIYRLSPVQQGMLFLTLYSPGEGVYFEQFNTAFGAAFQPALFQRIWQEAADRHPILRTSFVWEGLEEPVQVVHRQVELPFEVLDWRDVAAADQAAKLEEFSAGLRRQGFNLVEPPLMRLTVIRLKDDLFQVVWSYHHLILDGWSVGLLLQEVTALYYAAAAAGETVPPVQARRPFRDYIAWLRQQDLAQAEAYWRKMLGGFRAPTPMGVDLPAGRARPERTGRDMKAAYVPEVETEALKAWSRESRLTLSTVVQGAWSLVLSRYSGQDDVVYGVTVSGRPPALAGVEAMLGCFINTLPIRVRLPEGERIRGWLQGLQADQVEMRRFEQSPLVQVLGWSDVPRPTPLFESIFVFEGFTETSSQGVFQRTGYPLTLVVGPDRELVMRLDYELERFEPAAIDRLLGHLQSVLSAFLAAPEGRLEEIGILTSAERRQLAGWSATGVRYDGADLLLHQIIEARVALQPEAPAVVFAGTSLTYGELDARAGRLAGRLRALGAGPEVLVGVCAERSLEMVVALLAVLKAGGGYVPFDPSYPADRLAYMLADSHVPVLLTQAALRDRLPDLEASVLLLEDDDEEDLPGDQAPAAAGDPVITPDNVAYMIYTSGSTGRPKGAMNTHRAIVNRLLWMQDALGLDPTDRVLQKTPFSFDVSVWEFFWPLMMGACLVVAKPGGHQDPDYLVDEIARERVTTLHFVPSMLQVFLEAQGLERCVSLRRVVCSGEALPAELARRYYEILAAPLINLYGPTEAAVDVSAWWCRRGDESTTVPIGHPVANTELHIVDRAGRRVPVGVAGELLIGGVQVGRGYRGRPELTAEKFVPDPFGAMEPGRGGARVYRTGDLARHLPDGAIEFLGRIDHQVKIRGLRIELGEIEAALTAHPSVREAVVVATADQRLIGYLVAAAGEEISPAILRAHLAATLPEHMVPTLFVPLDAFPLSPNGKVDRRALPAAGAVAGGVAAFVAPRAPLEEMVAGIWSEVLKVDRVGRDDNFFELGGHSLLVTRVRSRLRETLGVDVPLRGLFEAATVVAQAALAEVALQTAAKITMPPLRRIPRDGDIPLSFGQERFWFIDRLRPGSAAYNMPGRVRVEGRLDAPALRRAFTEVARRHESLRTILPIRNGRPVQVILPGVGPLASIDLSGLPEPQRAAAARALVTAEALRPFELASGPLVRFTLLRLAAEEHLLLITVHHIVSDGWSMGVLVREIGELYTAFSTGRAASLPELPVQYADFAVWQREWLQGEVLEAQLAYWREQLAGAPPVTLFPVDRPWGTMPVMGDRWTLTLPADLTQGLKALARRQGATLFMVLLAAIDALLLRYGAQEDLLLGSPIAGRGRVELEGLIGLFLNTLVLRTDASGDPAFATLLGRARETTLSAYGHQDVPLEKLVDELAPERSAAQAPFFQILFVLQNAPLEALALPGITLTPVQTEAEAVKSDFTFDATEAGPELLIVLRYDAGLFDRATAVRLGGHLERLLEEGLADEARPVGALPLLSGSEAQQLREWSATAAAYPPELLLHRLIEAQVDRSPESLAVIAGDAALTYRELDRRANGLARRLRAMGVGPEVPVGVCAERSLEMVVALLAVLKAGGSYVPLDPSYPADRLAYMVASAGAPVLLVQPALLDRLPEHGARVLPLALVEGEERLAGVDIDPEGLAYAIFTSGSTGRPKGAMNSHCGIVNRLLWMQETFGLDATDRVLQKTPFSFDVSVWEFFWPLMTGARLVMATPGGHQDPAYLVEEIARQGITTLHFVPSMLQVFLGARGLRGCGSLRRVLCSGEALPADLVRRFQAVLEVPLHNLYGPTEAAVDVSWWACEREGARSSVPIGRPVANTSLHIVDREGEWVPIGAAGELCIGGMQVGRGYLSQPDLTAERFVPDPFGQPGARAYRTGDLARFLPDGAIDFLGRLDHQVKIRGFRIELGEIEAALTAQDSVREAVVVASRSSGTMGDWRLVAYVVPTGDAGVTPGDLRDRLGASLPEYMVPASFVLLAELPLNPNGKVDRKALPVPGDGAAPAAAAEHVPPRSPLERGLAKLWSEVLGGLAVERIGLGDRFFDLGGNSITGAIFVNNLQEILGETIHVVALFDAPVLEQFAAFVAREHPASVARVWGEAASDQEPGERVAGHGLVAAPLAPGGWREGEPQPVSFAQERLWLLDQLDPGTRTYNVSMGVRLTGRLHLPVLAASLAEIVRRHAALRTTFAARRGNPVQIAGPALMPPMPVVDLSALPTAARERAARSAVAAHTGEPFDLARGPLLRVLLARLGNGGHIASFTAHHIVCDGWSIGVLVREVAALYAAGVEARPSPLPELAVQSVDVARWQRQWLEGDVLAGQLAYWHDRLAGVPVLQLPGDRPRPSVQSFRGSTHGFVLSPELSTALRALSRESGATAFMTVLAAYQALLGRLSGQEDFAVGSPVAGRNRKELEPLIGFFVNTLVLRSGLAGVSDFRSLLERVRRGALEAYGHQDVPFERIVQDIAPERNLSHSPLFQVMLAFQNAPAGALELPGLTLAPLAEEFTTSKFDISLTVFDNGPQIFGQWVYSTALFEEATIRRWAGHFQTLLEGLAADPGGRLAELPLLAPVERDQILLEWNRPPADYPEEGFVHRLFEAQAARTPDAVAVAFAEESLSYRQLNERANRFARRLHGLGVGPESVVGISAERSFELVVGLLAILKAGGAYLPLDPGLPAERLAFMMADASIELLLTQERLLPNLPVDRDGLGIVALDGAGDGTEPAGNPDVSLLAANAAYVIYTSGSTGQPKGGVVSHGALGNRLQYARSGDVREGDAFLQKTTIGFDVSLLEIFAPLVVGGRTVLARPGGQQDPAYLVRLIREQGITYTSFPPTLLAVLFEHEGFDRCTSLRTVITGGETVPTSLPGQFYAVLPGADLLNRYGPTEATISVTSWLCEREGTPRTLPIGRPTAKARVYLLDRELQAVPVGMAGEIFLGGLCVARGYLRQPALTAEKFVPDPFSGDTGGRLYRTGDLARYRPDGAIEFAGRVDTQVKIRGFRVELGEIEAALAQHPAVREVAVVDREDGPTRSLAAYLVGSPDRAPEEAELRRFLLTTLPAYMVPADFVILEALPLSPAGKVDRRALPAPERRSAAVDFVAPRTATEERLVAIWAALLSRERVGVQDGFFDLGGHSLLAAQVISRVRESLGVELPLRLLFERPTVAALAEAVDAALRDGSGAVAAPLVPVPRGEDLPLSFAQQRLWFLEQLQPGTSTYNMPSAVRFRGSLDVAVLRRSLREVVRRHESLRTTFAVRGGAPVQVVAGELMLELPVIDLRWIAGDEREAALRRLAGEESRRPFDLAAGPLVRATLLRSGDEEHVALLTMHHIVADGWSMGVLIRELAALYPAFLAGEPSPLPELAVQYGDFAVWQRQWLQGGVLAAQLAYWLQALDGHAVLQLPTDRPRPAVQQFRGTDEPLAFDREVSQGLLDLGRRQGATPYMTLLAGFQALLHRYSGQDDVIVGGTVAGRDRGELEPLVGFFVNTLAMRTDLSGRPTFRELLGRVREVALGALSHQDLPFERLVEELQLVRDLSRSPLFQVVFQLQQPLSRLTLPGLTLSPVEGSGQGAKFDLVLTMREAGGNLAGAWSFNTDLFDRATLTRMSRHLEVLLTGAAGDPDRRLADLDILTPAERQQLGLEAGAGPAESLSGSCLHEIFAARAAGSPEAVAVTCAGERLSYGELDRRANRLARHLIHCGVGAGDLVGLLLERSVEMVVAILGVLKAGGAYLPLDPAYPRERLTFMLEDSRVPVLIAQESLADLLEPGAASQVLLVDRDRERIAGESDEALAVPVSAGHPAYVIYTSGSTGRPKGVVVRHGNVTRLFTATSRWFGFGDQDVWTLFHSYAFDFSVWEIWGALLHGGRLVVVPYWVSRSPEAFYELLAAERVTVLNQTPSAFRQLIWAEGAALGNAEPDLALRYVIFGGEALEPASLAPWFARHSDEQPRLINMYGITETTVHVTYRSIGKADVTGAGSVIGEAIPDLGLYVLDAASQPSPVGVPGEIHVGGAGLALGYLGRPELTAERFVPNPYGGPGSRLYRSGDLARHLAGGDLEYLGRIDHQVKIRGFRIELGEIESALAAHPAVREAVVLARADGGRHEERRLVAYVVSEGAAPSLTELRDTLAAGLPEYMLPSALVVLQSLPLTANGKVDRRALPAPEAARSAGLERSFVAPATDLERFLAGFWQEVLGIPEVGLHDDFFALGGSSITGAVLISRLQEALGEIVHVMVIFNAPTIAEMSAVLVDQHAAAVERALGPGALGDGRPGEGGLPIPAVLVGLQPGGSQPPLFLVHPLSGELFLYRHLVAAMGPDQPVYGFQAVGFATDEEPLASVEAMAAVYVHALLSFQPRGPYLLAGSSLGGLIAFEMARALHSLGKEVAFLALLDAPDPARFVREEEDADGQAELSILQHVAQGAPGVTIEHLRALVPEDRLRLILDHGRAAGILAASFGLPELRRLVRVVRANRSAVRAYEPRPFDTGLLYIKAAEGLGDDAVWAGLALGGAEVLEVPGSHLSMHFPPHAETLAARLRECVARERTGKNRES